MKTIKNKAGISSKWKLVLTILAVLSLVKLFIYKKNNKY